MLIVYAYMRTRENSHWLIYLSPLPQGHSHKCPYDASIAEMLVDDTEPFTEVDRCFPMLIPLDFRHMLLDSCLLCYITTHVSGFVVPEVCVEKLDTLSFLKPPLPASSTLRSRNPAHKSARDSFCAALVDVCSAKNSVFSAGELGVRWNGDMGSLSKLEAPPGRARPACSRCSSVHSSSPAMTWRIWNLRGSERSRVRKWRK